MSREMHQDTMGLLRQQTNAADSRLTYRSNNHGLSTLCNSWWTPWWQLSTPVQRSTWHHRSHLYHCTPADSKYNHSFTYTNRASQVSVCVAKLECISAQKWTEWFPACLHLKFHLVNLCLKFVLYCLFICTFFPHCFCQSIKFYFFRIDSFSLAHCTYCRMYSRTQSTQYLALVHSRNHLVTYNVQQAPMHSKTE